MMNFPHQGWLGLRGTVTEIDKVEFLLDETGWDALELVSEATNGVEIMISELYLEITANKAN